mgnify:CR=1 FL=1
MIHALTSTMLFLFIAIVTSACIPLDKTAASAAYTAQIASCVERSKSREESVACRHVVNVQWGVCGPKGDLCDSRSSEEPLPAGVL